MADQLLFIRPYIQYEASTAILCRAGSDLGATLTGHHDFQLADDVIHKVHVGHYTFYSVSIVKNTKLLQKAQGIFCRGYRGGEGTSGDEVIRCDFRGTPASVEIQARTRAAVAAGAAGAAAAYGAAAAPGAGWPASMSASFFSDLSSSMLVPCESDRSEWTARMAQLRAQHANVIAGGGGGYMPPQRPRLQDLSDFMLVEQLLENVEAWRDESDSLFTDVENFSDQDRMHGLLLVKGTHATRDHVYINPLGLGPVTYSGSSRSREGKGDALDKGQTISELDSIQRRLIQVI